MNELFSAFAELAESKAALMRKEAAQLEKFSRQVRAGNIERLRKSPARSLLKNSLQDRAPNSTRQPSLPEYSYSDHLSPMEAAEYLSLKLSTLYHWRYTGQGPKSYKIGRSVRYRREDLDAFLLLDGTNKPAW